MKGENSYDEVSIGCGQTVPILYSTYIIYSHTIYCTLQQYTILYNIQYTNYVARL